MTCRAACTGVADPSSQFHSKHDGKRGLPGLRSSQPASPPSDSLSTAGESAALSPGLLHLANLHDACTHLPLLFLFLGSAGGLHGRHIANKGALSIPRWRHHCVGICSTKGCEHLKIDQTSTQRSVRKVGASRELVRRLNGASGHSY